MEVYHKERHTRDQIREVLRLVERQADSLKTTPPDPCRQFAAAGLMHCCGLLRGICVLDDANLGALAGILERQHWETWLVSLHILLRGDDALHEIVGDYVLHTRRLNKALDLGTAYDSDWEGPVKKLNFWQLAERLGPLLIQAGETGDATAAMGYNATYRVQSLFAVHAGLATFRAYIRDGETSWAVAPTPSALLQDSGQTAARYTLHLAKYVFDRFGIATNEVEEIWDELSAQANAGGTTSST